MLPLGDALVQAGQDVERGTRLKGALTGFELPLGIRLRLDGGLGGHRIGSSQLSGSAIRRDVQVPGRNTPGEYTAHLLGHQ